MNPICKENVLVCMWRWYLKRADEDQDNETTKVKEEGKEAKINENMNFLISLGTPLLFPSHYHHHQQKQRNILRSCDKRRKYEGYIYQILLVLLTSGKTF